MEVIVDEEDVRIDKYLASKTDYSRETITKMLAEEYIENILHYLMECSLKKKLLLMLR